MSIQLTLEQHLEDRRLVEVCPPRGLSTRMGRRYVYATPAVNQELDISSCQYFDPANAAAIRAFLDGISSGRYVTVGDGRNRQAEFKILDPAHDEVWEIRKRDQPSTRVFGRFAARDVFIATNIQTSNDLFSIEWLKKATNREFFPVWKREIRRCKAEWRKLFPSYEPVSGGNLNDYLTTAHDARRQ